MEVIITLLIAATVAIIFTKFLIFMMNYIQVLNQFRTIPDHQLKKYPFLGHSLVLRGEPVRTYEIILNVVEQLPLQGKELAVGWAGTVPIINIAGPNSAEVLLHSSHHIQKPFLYDFVHPWLGTGLLTSTGQKWKSRRRLLTPTFHFRILDDFLGVMNEKASKLAEKFAKYGNTEEIFDICNSISLCTLDIICETAMGKSINAMDNNDSEYVKAIRRATALIQERQKSPWLWSDFIFGHTKYGKEQKKCLSVLHNFTESVINKRIKEKHSRKHATKMQKRMAFLDMLLNVTDEEGRELSSNDIREEVDTFMFEGHDTTSAALSFALHLIGLHPLVQRKIQDELHEVFGDVQTLTVAMTDIKKLHYLEMVIKESVRLFPPVPVIGRVTSRDCEMDGHLIPTGTTCLLYTQVVNKNPNYWTEPESFNPERFSPENSDGRHPYSYLPFSAGPRNCIGQRFALIEEKVILAHILSQFSIESCEKTENLLLQGDIILKSRGGIKVRLQKRKMPDALPTASMLPPK